MKPILEALFDGKIIPWEQIGVTGNEYASVNQSIGREKEYLKNKLTKEDCERFEALESLYSQSGSMQDVETFIYGFRLGVLMMTEVFTGKDLFPRKE